MTKAPAVKSFLYDLASGMSIVSAQQVDVSYGWPGRTPERRWVMAGDINWQRAEWKTNRSREEEFSVEVTFSVQIKGGTAREVEDFASLMAADFETALKANPSLSGLAVTTGFMPRSLKSWPIDGAFEAEFQTEVSATCRP